MFLKYFFKKVLFLLESQQVTMLTLILVTDLRSHFFNLIYFSGTNLVIWVEGFLWDGTALNVHQNRWGLSSISKGGFVEGKSARFRLNYLPN